MIEARLTGYKWQLKFHDFSPKSPLNECEV